MSRLQRTTHQWWGTVAAAAVLLGMIGLAVSGPPSVFAENGVDDLLAVDLDTTDNTDPRTIGNVAAFAELAVGETRSVDIVVENVDNLVGFVFRVDFPPYLRVNSVEGAGSFVLAGLGLLPPDGAFIDLQTPDSDGFEVQAVALTGDTGPNTTGTLFRFEIEAISTGSGGSIVLGFVPGESELLLSVAMIEPFVPAVVQAGVVNVVAAGSAGGGGGGAGGGSGGGGAVVAPPPADSDQDGLTDPDEALLGTDPADPDTDGDGLLDGEEANDLATDPLEPDSDADGLSDGEEVLLAGTDALNPDTDGDGISDGDEVIALGTNPLAADTDGDGVDDGVEVMQGSDPADAGDGGEPPAMEPPIDPAVVSQTLDAGFNPLTYTGSESVPVLDFVGIVGTRLIGVWRYEAETQSFVSYRVDAPAFANMLEEIHPRDALLVLLSAGGSVTVETPPLAPVSRSIAIVNGWNQIGYTGPDGTPIAELLGSLEVQSAWLFDQATESWLANFPGQAAFLQQFELVDGNALLFFRATAAGTLVFAEAAR